MMNRFILLIIEHLYSFCFEIILQRGSSQSSQCLLVLQRVEDVSLYNAAIHGMCLRGKIESAKKLYMRMRKSGLKPDGKTRALMLQNLAKHSIRRSCRRPRRYIK